MRKDRDVGLPAALKLPAAMLAAAVRRSELVLRTLLLAALAAADDGLPNAGAADAAE